MLDILEHDGVREIRMNRAPANALNPELVDSINQALIAAGEESRAVVLSGREGMFSAGLDVPALMQLDKEDMSSFWDSFSGLLQTIAFMPVPTVAAITGHSPAGGAVMSLFTDYRVMSDGRFKIGLNETQVGLSLPGFIHQALVRLVGPHRAERLVVSGALVGPAQALEVGLVDELAEDPASAIEAAIAFCKTHMALPPDAMLGNRKIMRESLYRLFDNREGEDQAFLEVWFSNETQATLDALVARLGKK